MSSSKKTGLEKLGCGDNSCVYGAPGGMGVNHGCRCFIDCPNEDRIKARNAIRMLRQYIEITDELMNQFSIFDLKHMRTHLGHGEEVIQTLRKLALLQQQIKEDK